MRTRWGAAFPAVWGNPQLGLWGVRATHGISALPYQWDPAGGEDGIDGINKTKDKEGLVVV